LGKQGFGKDLDWKGSTSYGRKGLGRKSFGIGLAHSDVEKDLLFGGNFLIPSLDKNLERMGGLNVSILFLRKLFGA